MWSPWQRLGDRRGRHPDWCGATLNPAWAVYDDSGTDTCFKNYGEPPPKL